MEIKKLVKNKKENEDNIGNIIQDIIVKMKKVKEYIKENYPQDKINSSEKY